MGDDHGLTDDPESGAGGLIATLTRQGHEVICAYGTAVFAMPLSQNEPGATGQSIYLTNSGYAAAQLKP